MININLLPEHLRGSEPTPMPLAITVLVGLVITMSLGWTIYRYQYSVIPKLKRDIANEKETERKLQEEEKQLQVLRGRIAMIREHVDAVRTLYKGRTIWARILSDIKHLVTEDESLDKANPGLRYLWLNNIAFKGDKLTLRGYASATNRNVAVEMQERLLRGFQTFAPTEIPEVAERRQIMEELEALRAGTPPESSDFASPEEREAKLRERLEELGSVNSGGIALMPFLTFIKPGSIQNLGGSWVKLPQPRRLTATSPDFAVLEQLLLPFPEDAWQFSIDMQMAPPPGSEE